MKKKVKILMKGFSEKEKKELENIEIEIVIRKRASKCFISIQRFAGIY